MLAALNGQGSSTMMTECASAGPDAGVEAAASSDNAATGAASLSPPAPPTSPYMWGACSVGPVLRSRLEAAGMPAPLPIQEAAFTPIVKGKNVVLASATGSGKTLAFLLPLLSTAKRDVGGQIIVVTASRELTVQLQKVTDELWPPPKRKGGSDGSSSSSSSGSSSTSASEAPIASSSVHIVGEGEGEEELLRLPDSAPILVGTPYALRRLMSATNGVFDPESRRRATALRKSLRVVVLDEADQLLESAEVAKVEAWRREVGQQQGKPLTARQRAALKQRQRPPSATELLLRELPVPLPRLQLICASATVGRSLRRQLQGLLGAPSIDKAAELIAAGDRDVKSADTRRAALMPTTLQHAYHLVGAATAEEEEEVQEKQEQPTAAADRTANAQVAEASTATSDGMQRGAEAAMLAALQDAMARLPPGPSIVFAGRVSVDAIVTALQDRGMTRVRRMQVAHQASEVGEADANEEQPDGTADDTVDDAINEAGAGGGGGVGENGTTASPAAWEDADIHVGSERWGRGLDLNVKYVFLLSPPSSTASYAHLAGRTGRRGRTGMAVTILTHTQAPRLVAFAEQLALNFVPLPPRDEL